MASSKKYFKAIKSASGKVIDLKHSPQLLAKSSPKTPKNKAMGSPIPRGTYYSLEEDAEIVSYVTREKYSFLDATNMSFWIEAENDGICVGRSAASLHERWRKLSLHVDNFKVDAKLTALIKKYAQSNIVARREMREKLLGQTPSRGPPFTRQEDKAILKFMNKDSEREIKRNDLHLWELAATKNICPGRTATSMMLRYRRIRNPVQARNKFGRSKTLNERKSESDGSEFELTESKAKRQNIYSESSSSDDESKSGDMPENNKDNAVKPCEDIKQMLLSVFSDSDSDQET